MAKIIVTSAVFDRDDRELLAIMEDAGHEVLFRTFHPQRTPDELAGLLEECLQQSSVSIRLRPK